MVSTFRTSFGVIERRPTLLVKLYDAEGRIGYGEAAALPAPLYSYETPGTCWEILAHFIAPLILHKEFTTVEEFVHAYQIVRGNPFAKTGVETAFWHLLAQEQGCALTHCIGGTRSKIPVGESLGIKSSCAELCAEIELRLREGYRRIKVKIEPGWDLEIVRELRETFGDIDLMVDANSAYTLKDIDLFKQLDAFHLTMIEQPLAHDDLVDHATLQQAISTPICLDESIHSAEDARKALELGSCRIINIKPGRVGGLLESKKIHDFCQAHGVPVWCGGMLETGIGRAFNIAIASLPNFTLPADMSPAKIFYKEDLIEPTYDIDAEGYIAVSQEPGLGYAIAEDRIERYTVAKQVIA
jgi:O-succinylbenzoate synthase